MAGACARLRPLDRVLTPGRCAQPQLRSVEIFPDFLDRSADQVARLLLGCTLERRVGEQMMSVRIVETEAYDQDDPASHSFGGRTDRNATMFGPSGHLYVYFIYGMHHCCNVVAGREGSAAAALIRAAEPLLGIDSLATNGPAKLCQALKIDRSLDGHDLRSAPLQLLAGELTDDETIAVSTRIGISKNTDALRRFTIAGNPHLSRR